MKYITIVLWLMAILILTVVSEVSTAGPPAMLVKHIDVHGYLAFSPNGKWLAVSGVSRSKECGSTTLLDLSTWNEIPLPSVQEFEASTSNAGPLTWTADSKNLLVGIVGSDWTGAFMVIAVPQMKVDQAWRSAAVNQNIEQICHVAGSKLIAYIAPCCDTVPIVDFTTGRRIASIQTPQKTQVALCASTMGHFLAIADNDTLILVEAPNGPVLRTIKLPGQISGLAMNDTTHRIAVIYLDEHNIYGRGTSTVWCQVLQTESLERTSGPSILPGGVAELRGVRFSTAGDRLYLLFNERLARGDRPVQGDALSYVLVRDSHDLSPVARLGPIPEEGTSIDVSPDGKFVAVSNIDQISVWLTDRGASSDQSMAGGLDGGGR